MLWYIIDGWNVVYQIKDLRRSPDPCRELARYVRSKNLCGSRRNRVTLVFDGRGIAVKESAEIVFSGEMSADEVIKRKVEKSSNRKQIVVVSDDREIAERVLMLGAGRMAVRDFLCRGRKDTGKKDDKSADKDIDLETRIRITEELKKRWLT